MVLEKPVEISKEELPEPLKSYWESKEKIYRPWKFFLWRGEVYVTNGPKSFSKKDELLTHWTETGCCGIGCYIRENKLELPDVPALVRRSNGEYLFLIKYGSYECIAESSIDGECFSVYSG